MKKIGVGIIGAGWISDWHIKGYKSLKDKVEILAIADIDKERVEKVARENEIKYAFTDYKKVLELEEIKAVNITTPTFLHKEMVVEASKAGKNILCEKPFAMTVQECEEMIRACRENKVLLMPGHNRIFFPADIEVRKIIEQGKIGEPKLFQGNHINDVITRHNSIKDTWRCKKNMGRGIVLESAIHEIYVIEKIMGKIESAMAYLHYKEGCEVEISGISNLRTEKGGLATITFSWEPPLRDDVELIIGEEGVICQNGVEWPRFHHPYLGIYLKKNKTWEFPEIDFNWDISFINMISHFVACIEGKEKPLITAYEGRDTIAVVETIYQSEKEERRIKVKRG